MEISTHIVALMPSASINGVDMLLCNRNKNGKFSISVALNEFYNRGSHEHDDVWHRIWKLRVPDRIQAFIWLIKHERLLTNDKLSKWGWARGNLSITGTVRRRFYMYYVTLNLSNPYGFM